jgi:hypothetical protein
MSPFTKRPKLVADKSPELPKVRGCLRCGKSFYSAWSGERICKQCKNTSSWRNGIAASFERRGTR